MSLMDTILGFFASTQVGILGNFAIVSKGTLMRVVPHGPGRVRPITKPKRFNIPLVFNARSIAMRSCKRVKRRRNRRNHGSPLNPHFSPASCYGCRSTRCAGAYSRKPLRHSVNYAFSVFQSVRPGTASGPTPSPTEPGEKCGLGELEALTGIPECRYSDFLPDG